MCSLSLSFEKRLIKDAHLKPQRNVLCRLHTRDILKKNSSPAWKEEVLFIEAVLNKFKLRIEHQKLPGIWNRFFKRPIFQLPKCNICRDLRKYERYHLKILLNLISDQDVKSAFVESPGLCIPHTFDVIEAFSQHKNLATLLNMQILKLQQIRDLTVSPDESLLSMMIGKRAIISDESDIHLNDETANIPENNAPAEDEIWLQNEKLKRKLDNMTKMYSEEASRSASLHYKLWKALKDIKVLEMNLAGTNSNLNLHKKELELLKEEINSFRNGNKCNHSDSE